jgi:glycosyltransferase involved in cell wall biosynthesis
MSGPSPAPIETGSSPEITVLICTRNRANQLKHVLTSAARMRIPQGLRWEMVVVDNGSSDATAEVVRSFVDRLPVRVVREEVAGLSNARNRGVAEARGRYICWTDDDVLIDEGWLAAYAAAFERHPEAAVFGGRIMPVLEAPTPVWFARLAGEWPLTTLLAMRDFGDVIALDFDDGVAPWGANFAVRAAEQRRVRYEPALGVSPHHRRVGEEAEVIYRILKSGAAGWWVPDAVVRHIIPVQRQTLRYVYDYFRASGETIAYMERTWPGAHHQSANQRDLERLRSGPALLHAKSLLNAAVFGGCWLAGARRHSLRFLMRAGFYAGAANLKRPAPADRPAIPQQAPT